MLVDDHAIVREGLAALLSRRPDIAIAGEAETSQEAIERFRQLRPDVVLMDLRMPGGDGIEAITHIRAEFSDARIIVLTTYENDEQIYQALRAGAMGYLLKDTLLPVIVEAIRAVYAGTRWVTPEISMRLADIIHRTELTEREIDVLRQLALGKSNQEIALALTITEGTVKAYVNRIFQKLEVTDRTKAVIVALKRGLVHLE
jgi:two-component system NarL family response regulator